MRKIWSLKLNLLSSSLALILYTKNQNCWFYLFYKHQKESNLYQRINPQRNPQQVEFNLQIFVNLYMLSDIFFYFYLLFFVAGFFFVIYQHFFFMTFPSHFSHQSNIQQNKLQPGCQTHQTLIIEEFEPGMYHVRVYVFALRWFLI